MSDEDPDFESAVAELEALVANMETGEFTLEESLVAFERGVELTRQCRNTLEQAELRVRALMPDGTEVPIDDVDTDSEG